MCPTLCVHYNCSIGAEEYIELLRVKLNSIVNSIVILDGDKNCDKINNKLTKMDSKNVIYLPGKECPEKYFYRFLYELDDSDVFWNNKLGGYDKEKCFSNFATLLERNSDTDQYKKWFDLQKSNWEYGYKKLFNYWMLTREEERDAFIQAFEKAYNSLAVINNFEAL